jgi:probable HAF family extracellular repeat protein
VLWEKDGSVTDLGNLGGTGNIALETGNIALSLNNQGQVVGGSALPGNTTVHAFLWTRHTGMRDLGALPRDVVCAGVGINNRGEVVGPSIDASGNPRAFLWQNGVMTDLNTLIPAGSPLFLLFASGINDVGEIVGFGVTGTGDVHGFLATPKHGEDNEDRSESLASASQSVTSPMVPSEDARRLLQQRLPFGRFGARLRGPR